MLFEDKLFEFQHHRFKSNFLQNQIWRPAAILNLNSKLKFDARNEFIGTKIHGNQLSNYGIKFKNTH